MTTIELFKNVFKGEIVEPSSPDYPEAISRWAKNAERNARYVLFPKDEQDISEAVKFATAINLPLAVKSGGHNPSGASSIDDGVSIDLNRYLDGARIDPEKKLAYVGGGALWRTVDSAAIKHGLATPAGTVNHTGVGGLILAGGFGYLTGKHGLTIDNVVQATVVLADGSIVTASDTSNPDLFWAIRGGGGNFGIVAEFILKLHPQRRTVFSGVLTFPSTVLQQIIAAVDHWWSEVGEDEGLMLAFARRGLDKTAKEEGRQRYKPLFDLGMFPHNFLSLSDQDITGPMTDTTGETPFEQINEMWNSITVPGRRIYQTGTSLRSTLATNATQIFKRTMELSDKHPTDSSRAPFEVLTIYELLPPYKICEISPDAMAYRSRGLQANVLIFVAWDEEEKGVDVKHARSISRELIAMINASADRELKEYENHSYGNYGQYFTLFIFCQMLTVTATDATDVKTKSLELWGDNYPRLQKIKHKYDPNSVFNRWIPIHPSA